MNKSCAAQRLVLDWHVFIVFWKVGSFKLFIYLHQTGTPFSFSQFYPLLLLLAYFLNLRESKRDFWLFLPGRSLASRTDGRTEQITKREKERERNLFGDIKRRRNFRFSFYGLTQTRVCALFTLPYFPINEVLPGRWELVYLRWMKAGRPACTIRIKTDEKLSHFEFWFGALNLAPAVCWLNLKGIEQFVAIVAAAQRQQFA